MTRDHQQLWDKIAAFDIDGGPGNALTFAARLARENGWTRRFADRAVVEYRRFAFLCMTAGRPMCPSEQVDQVWHLHLTYTRSYWHRFCRDVLGSPLHHDPTKGGAADATKHLDMYADTLAAYREAFGQVAPSDLWPTAAERFGDDLAERRVNVRKHWVVPKAPVRRFALSVGVLVAALLFAAGCNGPADLNPFDAKGTEFLPIYLGAYLICFSLAFLIRRAYRGPDITPGDPTPDLDPYETAYLKGGKPRVVAVALLRLKEHNVADLSADGSVVIRGRPAASADPVELAVYEPLAKQSGNKFSLKPIGAAVAEIEVERFARLEEVGILVARGRQTTGRLLSLLLVMAPVFLLAVPRVLTGISNGKPSGFLIAALAITFIVALVAFARRIGRSRKGDAVLADLARQRTGLLRTLNTGSAGAEVAMGLALFGTVALAGTSYASLRDRLKPLDSAGSSGGCGSGGCGGGGDGGGGGGGGCGGCGGGGGD